MENQQPTPVNVDSTLTRIRLLEERYATLRNKAQFVEQSMLKDVREIMHEIDVLTNQASSLQSSVMSIKEKLAKLTEEVNKSALKADVLEITKYIEYWEPVGFVTRKEVKDLLSSSRKQ